MSADFTLEDLRMAESLRERVKAPDELLMEAEEAESPALSLPDRVACVCGILQAVTHGAGSVAEVRARLLVLTAEAAPGLLPKGRLWQGRQAKRDLAAARGRLMARGLTWEAVTGTELLRLLTRGGWSAYAVGRRVLCLLYALTPDASLRPPMAQTLETIGAALGLRARNKRSGISAAIEAFAGALLAALGGGERGGSAAPRKFWFQKNPECRKRLKVSMQGKTNRKRKELAVVGGG